MLAVDLSEHLRYTFEMTTRRDGGKRGSGKRKGAHLQIRLEPAEKEAFEAAADLAGLALSAWVRERLRQITVRELEASGRRVAFLRHLEEDENP